jgi:predicted Zn-dependent peptidase
MKFNKTILKNGLRLVTVPMADNPSVTVLVMVEAGSKYETKDINGISHFLEHLVFKGTTKRPRASDISREFDAMGAEHNAFTSQEYTGYYGKAASEKCAALIEILSDMYINPLLDEAEMEKEKGVIIEEIRMYNDLPQRLAGYLFEELLYGDQPAGWKVLGTEDNIRKCTREQVVAYRSDHYRSASTIVVVSGSFDEKSVHADIERYFGDMPRGVTKPKAAVIERQTEPMIKTLFKDTDQTHLVIGVRTFPINDPRMPIVRVLAVILGGGMSSRLFSTMRNELGICYYIGASSDPSTDHGELSISAGVDNSRVDEGIKGILGECARLKGELVPADELQKVKDYIVGRTVLNLETSDARADIVAYDEALKGRIDDPEEALAKIRAVTAEQVRDMARELFVDAKLNMAIVGKFKDDSRFKEYFRFR